jgi:hypothetical protein
MRFSISPGGVSDSPCRASAWAWRTGPGAVTVSARKRLTRLSPRSRRVVWCGLMLGVAMPAQDWLEGWLVVAAWSVALSAPAVHANRRDGGRW